jgi:hypothetical protein
MTRASPLISRSGGVASCGLPPGVLLWRIFDPQISNLPQSTDWARSKGTGRDHDCHRGRRSVAPPVGSALGHAVQLLH